VVDKEDVVQLQVPMGHILLVHIVHSLQQLLDDLFDFTFWQEPAFKVFEFDVFVEANAFDVLHDQVQAFPGVNGLEQLHYVGVVQLLQQVYLPSHRPLPRSIRQNLLLVIDLHGEAVVGLFVEGGVDDSVGAFAKFLAEHVVLDAGGLGAVLGGGLLDGLGLVELVARRHHGGLYVHHPGALLEGSLHLGRRLLPLTQDEGLGVVLLLLGPLDGILPNSHPIILGLVLDDGRLDSLSGTHFVALLIVVGVDQDLGVLVIERRFVVY